MNVTESQNILEMSDTDGFIPIILILVENLVALSDISV